MKHLCIPVCTLLTVLLTPSAPLWGQAPAFGPETPLGSATYGSDRAVDLLAGLLRNDDVTLRVAATRDLGRTRNPKALDAIARAAKDPDPLVRATAGSAAANFNTDGSVDLAIEALQDTHTPVLLAALDALRRLSPASLPAAAADLAAHNDPSVRAATCQTFTALGQALPGPQLRTLLADADVSVRLRAAENARLAPDAAELAEPARTLYEGNEPPAIRAAALELLAHADAANDDLLAQAAQSNNVLIRRAAVQAFSELQRPDDVVTMLDDDSAIVRLAAIRACRHLTPPPAVARLSELMIAAPDAPTHQGARDALLAIGGNDVVTHTIESLETALARHASQPGEDENATRRQERINRNLIACCEILAALQADAATAGEAGPLLRNLLDLDVDQPPLGAAAIALGRLGQTQAAPRLREILTTCQTRGEQTLRAQAFSRDVPPYNQAVTGQVAHGLALLGDAEALPVMIEILKTRIAGAGRLPLANRYVLDALAAYDTLPPEQASVVRQAVLAVLDPDAGYEVRTQVHAARTAATMNLQAAIEPLQALLAIREGGGDVLAIYAWALGELTGEPVTPPTPMPNAGPWIITPTK